jgi:hypothetical protein
MIFVILKKTTLFHSFKEIFFSKGKAKLPQKSIFEGKKI